MLTFKPNPLIIPPIGRILGLDVGTKRVGVAVSDSAQSTALSKGTWARPWPQLKAQIAQSGVVGVVLGEPLHMAGTKGTGAQSVADLAALITAELHVPTALMDERLTSRAAEAAFFEQRVTGSRQTRASKKDSVGEVDAAAAVLLLQTWLSARRNS